MLVGAHLEVEVKLFKSFLEIVDQLLDSIDELLHSAPSHGVELDQVKKGLAIGALLELRLDFGDIPLLDSDGRGEDDECYEEQVLHDILIIA